MGAIAGKYSDILIATDDDPSRENRLQILNQLTEKLQESFYKQGKELFVIPERAYAIQLALEISRPGDLIIIAGKGHEKVQLTNFGKRKRSDQETILNYSK